MVFSRFTAKRLVSLIVLLSTAAVLFVMWFSNAAIEQSNVVLLCSIVDGNGNRQYPLKKVILDKSGLDLHSQVGQDMAQIGVKYSGAKMGMFPDQLIVVALFEKNKTTGRLEAQLNQTLSVIQGKIPAKNNQTVAECEAEMNPSANQ